MSGHLLLVGNPARRRRKAGARRKASPAQRAARARFAAMSRARSGGHKRRRRTVTLAANPARRRRARRNPINLGASMRSVVPMLKRSSVGAGGALLNDIAYGYALPFLPAFMQTPVSPAGGIGFGYHAGKIGAAVLVGMVAKHIPGMGRHAVAMTEGAMTVALHDAGKQFLVGMALPIPLGRLNPGVVVPGLPIAQNLRGLRDGRGGSRNMGGMNQYVGKYVGPGSTSMREQSGVR